MSCQKKGILLLMLISFVQHAASQNPCHPFCAPYACHGPNESNCDECQGNAMLEVNACVCKPGWFSVTTRCDTYVPNCKEIQITNGVVSCLSCQSARDVYDGTNCVRANKIFFLKSTTSTYTASAADRSDANYFLANQCMSIGSTGKCQECYEGGTINGAGACTYTPTTCAKANTAGTCLKAKAYYYLASTSPLSTGFCFGACATCVDGRYGGCLSCPKQFYFKPNSDSNMLGNCYPCHSTCDRCVGPLNTDCTDTLAGYFVERTDVATMNQVLACPSGCARCTSAQMCLWCQGGKISIDGICSTQTNTISGCFYQYRTTSPSSDVCLQYTSAFITATDNKGYTVTSSAATSKCTRFGFSQTDRVTMECKSCSANYILVNGVCFLASSTFITNCMIQVPLTTAVNICLVCNTGYVLSKNKDACGTTCSAGETIVSESPAFSACSPCPQRCTACIFEDQKLKCISCETSYALYKDSCMSQVCGDGIITLNKECDISLTPDTCTSDCLLKSLPLCPSSTSCTREIFSLSSSPSTDHSVPSLSPGATETFIFSVTQQYSDKVAFTLDTNIIYDSSDPAALKFLCGRVFSLISDPAAVCTYNPTAGTASIQVSRNTALWLSTQTWTKINTAAITVSRKYISQLAFTVSPDVPVTTNMAHISKPFLITTPPVAPSNQDLEMTYELLDPSVSVQSVSYTVTSAKINGVDQPQLVSQFNTQLATPVSGKFVIPSAQLSDNLVIGYSVVLTSSDGSTATVTSTAEIGQSSLPKWLSLLRGKRLVENLSQLACELHLAFLGTSFTPGSFSLKVGGVNVPTSSYTVAFLEQVGVLVLNFTPGSALQQDFWLEVAYTGSVSEYIRFKTLQPEIQPSILIKNVHTVGQQIRFWTSVGPDVNFATYCFSKSSSVLHFSTTPTASGYSVTIPRSVGVVGIAEFFLVMTRGTLSRTLRFELDIQASGAVPADSTWELPVSGMYVDGSSLHSAQKELIWGFPRTDWVTSLQLPPVAPIELITLGGKEVVNMGLTNLGNQIKTSSGPQQGITRPATSAELSLNYGSRVASFRTVRSLSSLFGSPSATFTSTLVTPILGLDNTFDIHFEAQTHERCIDPAQYVQILRFDYPSPLVSPFLLPSPLRRLISLHPYILSPALPVTSLYFDTHRFTKSNTASLSTTSPPTSLASLTTYLNSLLSGPPSPNPASQLHSLSLLTLQLNLATLKCLSAPPCPTSPDAQELPKLRWTAFQQFRIFWDSVTDKQTFSTDWYTSLTKSVVLNGLTASSRGVSDSDIRWIDAETQRETKALFAGVQTQRNLFGRFTYELVETLKPIMTLTIFNLDQHTSAVSHALQLYVEAYQSFTSGDECSAALNTLYKHILGLNEVRLIRYTLPSTTSFYENENLAVAGLTLTEPLAASQTIWVGEDVAVEVKNLQFEPTLDSYELSVIVFKDSFFDSLKGLLEKFNLTSPLEQSRTSISFTNQFELVYPKLKNETEINIYRAPEECRGTPCNINRQLSPGVGKDPLILCECLVQTSGELAKKPTPNPTSPPQTPDTNKPLQNLTEETGKVLTGLKNQTQQGVKCLFGNPEECVQNKRIWLSSIMFIFGFMSVLSILACVLDTVITRFALGFVARNKISFAVDNLLSQQTASLNKPATLTLADDRMFDRQSSAESTSVSSGSAQQQTDTTWSALSPDQRVKVKQFLAELPDGAVLEKLKTRDIERMASLQKLKKMSTRDKFKQVASLSHSISSIITSQSKQQSRKTLIFLLYLRAVYELALSMYFSLGLGTQTSDFYLKFMLRCLLSMSVVSVVIPLMKWLARTDMMYGMSAIWWIPLKTKKDPEIKRQETASAEPTTPVSTDLQPTRVPFKSRVRTRSQMHRPPSLSIQKVSPANSTVMAGSNRKGSDVFDSLPDRMPSSQALSAIPSPSAVKLPTTDQNTPNRHSQVQNNQDKPRSLLLIYSAYLCMYGLLLGCILVIFSVSKSNDETGNWPWGYWYLIQFGLSSTIGSLPAIFLQWVFLRVRTRHLNSLQTSCSTKPPCLASPHLLFNNDIYNLPCLLQYRPIPQPHEDLPEPAQEVHDGHEI